MISDRQIKKRTAFMVPEDIEMIAQMREELEYKEKLILAEQKIEENAKKLQLASHDNLIARELP